MKVLDVTEVKSEIVEVDSGRWRTYRRQSFNNWEVLMGASWESVYKERHELEQAYQDYKWRSDVERLGLKL